MTFPPGKVMTQEEWRARHPGHRVAKMTETISIKRLHWLVCQTCNERFCYRMETIEPPR